MQEQGQILEMSNIFKAFGGIQALSGVSLSCQAQEVHCLVGENGAGKSTLMKILSGAIPYPQYKGTITLENQSVRFRNPRDAERAGIAIIYQELNLIQEMNVAENIFLGQEKQRWPLLDHRTMHREAAVLLKTLGAEMDTHVKVKNLGLGRQQLVEIAKALSKKAKVFVLDEPTSSLSQSETEVLFSIIQKLQEQGMTLIYISHKLDEIFQIADRITILRDGETVATFSAPQVTKEKLVALMVGREISKIYPEREKVRGDVILEVRNFGVSHPFLPGEKIVRDVSLKIRRGEIVGLAGLMGSGRSELLAGIFGLFPEETYGELLLDGKIVQLTSPAQAIEKGIGYLTEDRKNLGLVHPMSVTENITLAGMNRVCTGPFIQKRKESSIADRYAQEMKIKTASPNAAVSTLSGGNQQKVLLSRCLLNEPNILLLDEPTRGVDVGAKVEIYQIIHHLAGKGVGILFASSDLLEVLGLSNRILVMREGKVTTELRAEDATQEKVMTAATSIQ